MPTKPPTIVHYVHRPKRAPKKKAQPGIPHRIVTMPSKRAKTATPEAEPEAAAAVPERPRIVTAPRKTSTRFGPVQDIDAEEHQRRGDAAEALFRELVRGARE